MSISYIKEVCVETLDQCIAAEKQGADRLELCSRLDLDGLTPNLCLVEEVIKKVSIPVRIMIRPRGGNFIYNEMDLEQMKKSIELLNKFSIDGIVTGVLTDSNELNIEVIKWLIQIAAPLPVIIHKSIDITRNPLKEIDRLKNLSGNLSVLTSGGLGNAFDNIDVLKQMIKLADNQINIIVAGGITNKNLPKLHRRIQANEYHGKRIVGKV